MPFTLWQNGEKCDEFVNPLIRPRLLDGFSYHIICDEKDLFHLTLEDEVLGVEF